MFKKLMIMIIYIIVVMGLLTSCGSRNYPHQSVPTSDDTNTPPGNDVKDEKIVLRLEGDDIGIPNPFRHKRRGPGVSRMQLLYDSLLERDEHGDIPWLASDWSVIEDGMAYTSPLEKKVRDNAIKTGEYELLLVDYGGLSRDPDYLRSTLLGKRSIRGWSNKQFIKLARQQTSEKDIVKRKEIINEMQDIIANELPIIMLYGDIYNYVYRPKVYEGWMSRYDHSEVDHNKLSFMER